MKRVDNCKKRAQKERLPLQQIYRQDMVAALTDLKQPELVARKVPKFENKKNGAIFTLFRASVKIFKQRIYLQNIAMI